MKWIRKICNKTLIMMFIVSILVCGCTQNKMNNVSNEIERLKFTGLDDENLHDYVLETLYSGIDSNFTTDDYQIQEITTIYLSKEYLEELDYNSKSNLYFGYTLSELASKFNGKKYVFEVDENNQTTVVEFKDYENNYKKMIKNVLIGTGVILICATVSLATGGTVSIIFAASAKTATEFAVSSAALSGIISSAIEYYKTGNIEKSLEKGALNASESFKWGAILGGVTGGITETITQISAAKDLKSLNAMERGTKSEVRAQSKYGGREQVSYLNGKEVNASEFGATRPDLVRNVNGKLEAIEVKNYNLNSEVSRNSLYEKLKKQVTDRVKNLPEGSTQRIVLDVQGRNYSKDTISEVIKNIQSKCNDIYPNIPIDIMT